MPSEERWRPGVRSEVTMADWGGFRIGRVLHLSSSHILYIFVAASVEDVVYSLRYVFLYKQSKFPRRVGCPKARHDEWPASGRFSGVSDT